MQIKCTTTQAAELLNARKLPTHQRKAVKKRIFQQIHAMHSLPKKPPIVLFVENEDNPLYCVIRDKRTRLPLDDGRPEPKSTAVTKSLPAPADSLKTAPKKAVKAKAVAVVKKAAAKAVAKPVSKAKAVKAVAASKVKPVAKPGAKAVKAVAASKVKPVAKPGAKAVKAVAASKVKPVAKAKAVAASKAKAVAKPAVKAKSVKA
jgi:hypothetical protein